MTQHTQGPWHVAKPNCGLGIFDANGKSVAAIASTQKRSWVEMESNARLIAAAPELLEVLKEARDQYVDANSIAYPEEKDQWPLLLKMEKAIAKARGE